MEKDFSKIIDTLRKDGIYIHPGFLDQTTLNLLQQEFEMLQTTTLKGVDTIEYSAGIGKVVRKHNVDTAQIPETSKFFYNSTFQEISDKYLGTKNDLNADIFVVKDVVGSKHHANDLHFDVKSTFKFFLYLTDTDETNGAFCCVPGSQKYTAEIRKRLGDQISYENRSVTREHPYSDEDIISVNGKAGTLIIFDTDVFHKAGHVSEGERRVMRGHTRSITKSIPQKLSTPEGENSSLWKRIKSKFK